MIYKIKCKKCGHTFKTAFGIVGTTLIAQPAKKCPKCKAIIREEIRSIMQRRKKQGFLRNQKETTRGKRETRRGEEG